MGIKVENLKFKVGSSQIVVLNVLCYRVLVSQLNGVAEKRARKNMENRSFWFRSFAGVDLGFVLLISLNKLKDLSF